VTTGEAGPRRGGARGARLGGVRGVVTPGGYCELLPRRPGIERRRVATGANHPASHSSAFRRGPGTPAGAPTGDQSTAMHVTPKPPLVRQDRITSRSGHGLVLSACSAVSGRLFRLCFLAKRPGRLRPRGCPLRGGPPSRPPGCVRGNVAFWQAWLVGTKTSSPSGLAAAVGDHYGEIGDGDSAHRRNPRPPPRARDEQGNRGRKTSDPDSHHDQVAALPRGNVRRQGRLCLRDEIRAVTARPSAGFHPPNVRPPGAAGECGFRRRCAGSAGRSRSVIHGGREAGKLVHRAGASQRHDVGQAVGQTVQPRLHPSCPAAGQGP
jgi:hypothetical protein